VETFFTGLADVVAIFAMSVIDRKEPSEREFVVVFAEEGILVGLDFLLAIDACLCAGSIDDLEVVLLIQLHLEMFL
jgi:hypothetical protein